MSQMQRIPLHAKEVKIFKPRSLAELPEIPSFTLRAPTRQHREDMIYAMREAGLRKHTDETMREAMIEELCRLWECGEGDENVERLRAYWRAADDYNEGAEAWLVEAQAAKDAGQDPPAKLEDFEHPDAHLIADLLDKLDRRSDRLRRMGTDSVKFARALPRYAVAYSLAAWTGLETAPRFQDGLLTIESVFEMEEELETRFGELGKDAIAELGDAAIARLFLSKEAEKNFESGPASQQTPDHMKADGSASPSGTSQDLASSEATPAA